jgi:signal transduction histidine kinase
MGGTAAVYDHGSIQTFGKDEGLTGGQVVAMTEDRAGAVWIATAGGLNRYQNGRITAVTQANAPLTEIVPSLVEDGEGFLWVGIKAGAGLVRFHPRELDKLAMNPKAPLEYELYDSSDGLPQGALGWQAGVTGVRGGDGRLWFASGLGVATIDPRERPRTRHARTPQVDAVTADGRPLALARGLELPSRTSTLRIDYSAVSLSAASKLRFRYMLEGLSDQWVSAGTTRDVVFTDLPSGEYRFRVSSTYDGEWADAASWDFSVAPPLYRTRSFLLAFAVVLTLLLIAAWWLRLQSVRNQYSLVFAERARMGREIHDTLLQSLAAIGFELETIAAQVDPAQARLKDSVRLLRLQVGHSLREARESVLDLRRTPMKERGLVQKLTDLAEHTSRTGLPTDLTVDGRIGSLPDEVEIQLFRIAQEASSNARRHGQPKHLRLGLRPRPGSLVLSIEDDGKGFDPEEHAKAPDMGHQLGLASMRERAERVRGTLSIRSTPGHGTVIEATVPVPSV